MKTIRQVADEIGVSKQAVRDKIAKLGLQNTLQKIGKSFAIPKSTETALLKAFTENQPQSPSQSIDKTTDKLIAMLEVELDVKNKQINDLTQQLAEKDKQIDFLQTAFTNQQLLHGGTIQQQLTASATDEQKTPVTVAPETVQTKKGLWKLFSRKL